MTTTFISINKQVVARNAKLRLNDPPVRIAKSKWDSKPQYAHEVEIKGPSKLIYDPDKPLLKCGARLVLATEGEVEIIK